MNTASSIVCPLSKKMLCEELTLMMYACSQLRLVNTFQSIIKPIHVVYENPRHQNLAMHMTTNASTADIFRNDDLPKKYE